LCWWCERRRRKSFVFLRKVGFFWVKKGSSKGGISGFPEGSSFTGSQWIMKEVAAAEIVNRRSGYR
jgi:hypothetical protein